MRQAYADHSAVELVVDTCAVASTMMTAWLTSAPDNPPCPKISSTSTPSSVRTTTSIPDPSDPDQKVAFGTSGHRGSSLDTAFNQNHIWATTQAIVEYRAMQGTTGPLLIGRDTHALSLPAWHSALEVLVANDVTVLVDDAGQLHPDAGGLARDLAA